MPRPPRAVVAAAPPPNSLVAAPVRPLLAAPTPDRGNLTWQGWQQEAWDFHESVGELQYAAGYFGSCLRRTRLYTAKRQGRDFQTVQTGPAVDILADYFGGPEGQAGAMALTGIHLFVVGECYHVGRRARTDRSETWDGTRWEVVGVSEMRSQGQEWQIHYAGDSKPPVTLKADEDVIRIWTPDPKHPKRAISPVKGVLGPLAEIAATSLHIRTQLISRLKNDVLFLPQGVTFPTPEGSNLPEDASEADKVMEYFFRAMNTAIAQPGTASAAIPIVVLVPDEFNIGQDNLLKLWSTLDEKVIEMRADAIKRFAHGVNLPAEVVTGTADMNHWGAWQVDESSIKIHIEPAADVIVNILSTDLIQSQTDDRADVVRYDTTALRLRPNRSKEAVELWDRGQLKTATLLRETGFDPVEDAPDDEEQRRWLLIKVASGSATPEQVQAALKALGVQLNVAEPLDNTTPRDSRPAPSLLEHPTRELPQPEAAAMEVGLYPACYALVDRALERAGNRIRSLSGRRPEGVAAVDMYRHYPARADDVDRLMEDAWSAIPRVLKHIPFDQQQAIRAGLDDYLRELLTHGDEHEMERMKQFLTHSVVRTLV